MVRLAELKLTAIVIHQIAKGAVRRNDLKEGIALDARNLKLEIRNWKNRTG